MTEMVYRDLRKAIIEGELEAGRRLLIMDIAKKSNISQAPVREALARLRQEGLVTSHQNKGSFVAIITEKDIYDIGKVREVLEGHAVKESMLSLTPRDFEQLEWIVEQMEGTAVENNPYRLIELDMDFHGFFYERCNNSTMLEIWNSIKTKIMRFNAVTSNNYTSKDLVTGHKELIEVVKSKDVGLAVHKFHSHIQSYRKFKYNHSSNSDPLSINDNG